MVAALFLLAHSYTGVRHDGTLYAGEALARLAPGDLNADLYFLYGSQGRFTVLPLLYARLIDWFGFGTGSMVGLLFAGALYLAASAYLVAALVPRHWRTVSLLAVVLGWSIYGGTRTFSYAEPFLTARSYAEPAVLLGLGLLLRGRFIGALLALVAALLVHPLIAVGGFLVAWLYLVQRDRRWSLLLPLGACALAALGWMQVGPFADLFSRYDDDWLTRLRELNPQAFVAGWSPLDFGILVYNVCLLGLAWHRTTSIDLRRFLLAAAIAGLGATLVSAVTVDLALNPFFGKLQIWRAEWVMQWVAVVSLPFLAKQLWDLDRHGRIAAALLVIGWLAPYSVAPAWLGLFAVVVVVLRGRFTVSTSLVRIVVGLTALIALILFVKVEMRAVSLGMTMGLTGPRMYAQMLTSPILLASLGLAFLYWHARRTALTAMVAVLGLVGAFTLWDQRADWTKTLEAHRVGDFIWTDQIEPRAKVFWYGDLFAPWILLGHGNYYTSQQGSGAVFSREMVMELGRRNEATSALQFQEQLCRMVNNLNEKQSSCEPDTVAVRSICESAGIDYMVLQSRLEGIVPLKELTTHVVENGYEKRFFLYRCSAL